MKRSPSPVAARPADRRGALRWLSRSPHWRWVAVLVASLLAVACRPAPELPVYGEAPPFALVNQDGQPASRESLDGKVWLASFIFTSCTDTCPLLTAKLAQVQRELDQSNTFQRGVQLVSFTVDPERDRPEVLKAYAGRYNADLATWSFVTGPAPLMRTVVTNGFKIGFDPSPAEPGQVVHNNRFVLVDRQGKVRAYYDGLEAKPADIANDIRQLAGR